MVQLIKSELIRKKHDLIKILDKKENKDNLEFQQELEDIETLCDEELKKHLGTEQVAVFDKVKEVVDMKKLKKEIQTKYEEVREEYARLCEALNKNVELKKDMRILMKKINSDIKEGQVYELEVRDELKEKYSL